MILRYEDKDDEKSLASTPLLAGVKWKGKRPLIIIDEKEIRNKLSEIDSTRSYDLFRKYFVEHLIPCSNQTKKVIDGWMKVIDNN